jgi:hypothetical protein
MVHIQAVGFLPFSIITCNSVTVPAGSVRGRNLVAACDYSGRFARQSSSRDCHNTVFSCHFTCSQVVRLEKAPTRHLTAKPFKPCQSLPCLPPPRLDFSICLSSSLSLSSSSTNTQSRLGVVAELTSASSLTFPPTRRSRLKIPTETSSSSQPCRWIQKRPGGQ